MDGPIWYALGRQMFLIAPELDHTSTAPLYRQVYVYIKELIRTGKLAKGDRLPATRELAGQIGLNRATVTAAYELLETEGLIRSHVGRGSFVEAQPTGRVPAVGWRDLFIESDAASARAPQLSAGSVEISFATSSPSGDLFPLDEIGGTVKEVVDHGLAEILQLGSPTGYSPLRHYLHELGIESGELQPADEIMVTNGCQQALDLLQRILITRGDTVAVEDPVYPGIQQVIARAGARLVGIPVGPDGIEIERLEATLALERPKMLIVTPNFQNPTGRTLPLGSREAILRLVREHGAIVAENDTYADLRYQGAHVPSLKKLDDSGRVIQMRSFSKISFPGLRVGWVTGPRPVIARLADAKQWSDLHTDQLAQAVLWRFASSGRLEAHRQCVVEGGRRRLAATLEACEKHLPAGCKYSAPEGGMNLWLELPEPLDATALLPRALDRGVAYLPGRVFAVNRPQNGALRLSFAGLSPGKIEKGLATLGEIFRDELARAHEASRFDPAPAMV